MQANSRSILQRLQRKAGRIPFPEIEGKGIGPIRAALPDNISVRRHQPGRVLPKTRFNFLLVVNLCGPGALRVDESRHDFLPLHAMLIFPDQACRVERIAGRTPLWLAITFETRNMQALAGLRDMPMLLSAKALTCLEWLTDLYDARPPRSLFDGNRCMLLVSLLLLELISSASEASGGIPAQNKPDRFYNDLFVRANHFIYQNMCQPTRLRDLARHVHMSESHFSAIFKKHVGMSPGRFIRQRKVLFAARLLDSASASIETVASYCGLGSVYSFSRCFKREMKRSPLAFRHRNISK